METSVDLFGEMTTNYETDTISGRQGKRAEDLFRKILFWKLGIQPTTPKEGEDIFSHYDLCVDGHTYDVKSRKSISRGKPLQDAYQWIEYQNVRGDTGWLLGRADTIAFELKFTWMLVNRERLLELVRERVDLDDVKKKSNDTKIVPWQIYHREDVWDRIILAPLSEILTTEPVIWKK
jgi:hypothetical protein